MVAPLQIRKRKFSSYRRPIFLICRICRALKRTKPSALFTSFCCSRRCADIRAKTIFSGSRNPAYGKTYRTKATHPEWAQKSSDTHKERGTLVGDKNPMKNPVTAAKMSKTRRANVTSDPVYRAARAAKTRQNWKDGKYADVAVGKCKWYDHTTFDGTLVKLQGTWEVAFARRLDELKVAYIPHRGRWSYIGSDSFEHTYYPDFYIPMWDAYVDVKGAFWDDEQKNKLYFVRKSNVDKNIIIATKDVLDEWGVNVKKAQDDLLPDYYELRKEVA